MANKQKVSHAYHHVMYGRSSDGKIASAGTPSKEREEKYKSKGYATEVKRERAGKHTDISRLSWGKAKSEALKGKCK